MGGGRLGEKGRCGGGTMGKERVWEEGREWYGRRVVTLVGLRSLRGGNLTGQEEERWE